jgi:quinol monooxygenase YgiN
MWGAIAGRIGIPMSLVASAATLAIGLAAIPLFRLHGTEVLDLTPSMHWPEPEIVRETPMEGQPVLVTVEYRIDPAHASEFKKTMESAREERLRNGALRWELFGDTAAPDCYVELFVVESWAEHLRHHERITVAERDIETAARSSTSGRSHRRSGI